MRCYIFLSLFCFVERLSYAERGCGVDNNKVKVAVYEVLYRERAVFVACAGDAVAAKASAFVAFEVELTGSAVLNSSLL